jgi:hypothetical protein
MSWSKGEPRWCNDFLSAPIEVADRKNKFVSDFPEEAPQILECFEKIIFKKSKKIKRIGTTKDGKDIFLMRETFTIGKDHFDISIAFKADLFAVTWIGFSCEHSLIKQPTVSNSVQVLDDILASLRQKY